MCSIGRFGTYYKEEDYGVALATYRLASSPFQYPLFSLELSVAIARSSRRHRIATVPIIIFVLCGLVVPAATEAHANHSPSATRWQSIGLSGLSVHSMAVGAKEPDLAFAGTESGIYRFQGGHSWKRVLKSDSVGGVYLLPNDRTVLGCDNSGYVDVSTDGGTHWRQHLVTPLGVFSVSVQPGNARHILAGAAGGIYLSRDGGLHWQRRYDIKQGAAGAIAWAPGSSTVVFAGSAVSGSALHSAGVLYSRDAGLTWRPFGHHLNDGGAIMSLTVTPDHVYVGTMGNAVWRASMSMTTWQKAAAGMPEVNDHVVCRHHRLWRVPYHRLWRPLEKSLRRSVGGEQRHGGSLHGLRRSPAHALRGDRRWRVCTGAGVARRPLPARSVFDQPSPRAVGSSGDAFPGGAKAARRIRRHLT